MKIKTKYNVGDEVYIVEKGIIKRYKVYEIAISIWKQTIIRYRMAVSNELWLDEKKVFKSKKALIKSLKNQIIK